VHSKGSKLTKYSNKADQQEMIIVFFVVEINRSQLIGGLIGI
jgi:hypothetical protein